MPGSSCTSQIDNGCASCGPSVYLFAVSASANYPAPPGECPTYLSETYSASKNTSGRAVYFCPDNCAYQGVYSRSTTSSDITTIAVNEENGSTTVTRTQIFSSSINGQTTDSCSTINPRPGSVANCTNTSSTITTTITDVCGNVTTTSSSTYNPCIEGGIVGDWVDGCFDPGTCTTTETCDTVTVSSSAAEDPERYCGGFFNGNMQSKLTRSNPFNESLNSPSAIVDRQISRLKSNNFPCIDGCCQKCGGANGKKDDCWGGFGTFGVPDSTQTISKASFKIATPKEIFQKKYKSISGKVYFYFGGEEGETPCCQECGGPECFTGTVVKTLSYSLGSTDFREGQYLAADIGEISNTELQGYIGETISACITVDNIEFM